MAIQSVNQTTEAIIGAAIEVHKHLGPGLLESAYEECLCYELNLRTIPFQRQVLLPVVYKGTTLDCGYRIDLLVKNEVVVELKTIESILPIHEAQALTTCVSENGRVVKGIKWLVLGLKEQTPRSPRLCGKSS
jgi:GxxExxY protein